MTLTTEKKTPIEVDVDVETTVDGEDAVVHATIKGNLVQKQQVTSTD